jgi:hypothetical protein
LDLQALTGAAGIGGADAVGFGAVLTHRFELGLGMGEGGHGQENSDQDRN